MVNLTAFIQCLVVGLSKLYDDGAQLPQLDPWVIQENKWRATRYGLDADIIIDESGTQQSLKESIFETIDKVIPLAKALGCHKELSQIGHIIENNQAPYQRQIVKFQQNIDLSDVVILAIKELENGVSIEC
jgi:carboxylate-amine ligase